MVIAMWTRVKRWGLRSECLWAGVLMLLVLSFVPALELLFQVESLQVRVSEWPDDTVRGVDGMR
jgi:hypothetical protein